MNRCTGLLGATPVQRRGSVLLLCKVHKHTVPTRGESLGGGEGAGKAGGQAMALGFGSPVTSRECAKAGFL